MTFIPIASDHRERGNLTVCGTAKYGEIASASPRNDLDEGRSGQSHSSP